jgi:hypothetical protein
MDTRKYKRQCRDSYLPLFAHYIQDSQRLAAGYPHEQHITNWVLETSNPTARSFCSASSWTRNSAQS